jgi:putative membrane protein
MKTNLVTSLSHTGLAAVALICASVASAQNPRLHPTVSPSAAQSPSTPTMSADESTGPTKGAIGKGQPTTKGAKDNASVPSKDAIFLKQAAQGGIKEVAMGRMAEKNGQSNEVKALGQRLVSDHTALNKEIMAMAKKKGISLAQTAPPSDMKGSTFDRDFLHMVVEHHNNDIKAFQGEAKNGEDSEIKGLAQKALPTLQNHLTMAKAAQKKTPQMDSTQSQH